MSKILKAFFAVLAVSGTFGAVQLASGHDLAGFRQTVATPPVTNVNRAGKADRDAVRVAQDETTTITLKPAGLDESSVAVRIPVTKETARKGPAPAKPASTRPATKNAIACEPPVSVLTEVAKLLQPGRCVT